MDPVSVAAAIVAFLAPYLAEDGKAAAKEVGEKIVQALEHRFKEEQEAQTALADMKEDPQDKDNQADLRKKLKKALKKDAEFLNELAHLLQETEKTAPTYQAPVQDSAPIAQGQGPVTASTRGVAVGGNVEGSIIITGDNSEVEQK